MKHHNHKGRLRKELGLTTNKRRGPQEELPRLNVLSNSLLRKKLEQLVGNCPYREFTGEITKAPCCKSEGGKVFRCTLYKWKPAKYFNCLVCQKNKAVRENAHWIQPLIQLVQGTAITNRTVQEVISILEEK